MKKAAGTRAAGKCFHSLFQFSETIILECFYNLLKTWRTCFLFLLENATTKKGKQLVNFDYQNVNFLCLRHHYVNSLY